MPTFASHFNMQGDANFQAQVKGDIVSMLQAGCAVGGLLINVIGGKSFDPNINTIHFP